MQVVEQLDSVAIERLRKQGGLLLRIYRADFAKDPTSRATESSRSNVIAMQHTVRQIYGKAVAWDVANLVAHSNTASPPTPSTGRNDLSVFRTGKIADALIAKAPKGDVRACAEIADRTEGKAPQSMHIGGDAELRVIIETIG